MKVFWLRFSVFCLLWIVMIMQASDKLPVSILLFAVCAGIFFFLTLKPTNIGLYLGLTTIVLVHELVISGTSTCTIFLLLFFTIVSAFHFKERFLVIYGTANIVLSILISVWQQHHVVEMVITALFVLFLVYALNLITHERNELKELYDQLLGEYRKLKRMNLAARQNARLEERTKIARDIHDSVGHRLTALIMKLEMLSIQEQNPAYGELKQMVQESLNETRQAVKTLKTEENQGLAAVIHLIRKLEAESHILVQFTVKQGLLSVPLSNEKSVVLYRVIQEALTNVMRHAQSREVQIILGKSAVGAISFEVMNPIFVAKPFKLGFGLTNMKERVEGIGGKMEILQTETKFIIRGTIPSE